MLSRRAKASFYAAAGPLMRLNGAIHQHLRSSRSGEVKIHLGPGQKNYIDGWINIDANMFTARCDIWADLRNPLPFPDATVDAVYSHHVVEHLPSLREHFADVYRCLKPGGVYRVGGPNGDSAMAKFMQDDKAWFGDFPDNRKSIGGRFENFIFCRQEHLTILTRSFLEEVMADVGFAELKHCVPTRETHHAHLFHDCLSKEEENDFEWPHTLIVEGTKR